MRPFVKAFFAGLVVNRICIFGVVLTTSALVSFIIFEGSHLLGFHTNAYVGLITYMALPGLFIGGLSLIPGGWFWEMRRTHVTLHALLFERFEQRTVKARMLGSLLMRTILTLSMANVLFMGLVGTRMLHYMDSAEFCGTACHKVMGPEWAAYQQSPHAKVLCVDCHIGEGLGALVNAKMNGAWQMISLMAGLYATPIPTPVHNLRPAKYTCEECHWPEIFHENRIVNKVHYGFDEASTPHYSTLLMKVGSGREGLEKGIHWHVSQNNEIRYASVDNKSQTMIWVEVRKADGSFTKYSNTRLNSDQQSILRLTDFSRSNSAPAETPGDRADQEDAHSSEHGELHARTMDCVDCHNRVGHSFRDPEDAVDQAIRLGSIDASLPYIKSRSLGAIIKNYNDKEAARASIRSHLENYYKLNYPDVFAEKREAIDTAVLRLQQLYETNIHPQMRIRWNSYPDNMGHKNGGGCFRCHNSSMRDERGEKISFECTMCHSILANDETAPFKYLFSRDEQTPRATREMQRYLRKEFQETTHE